MRKTGLLGGTFDPIHIGHILLGQWAREAFGLDEVWFMPAGAPYQKDLNGVLPPEARLEMTRLALEGLDGMDVCDLELRRQGSTYTWETMAQLRALYPDRAFYYIIGADCLEGLATWRHPERILSCCDLIAAARGGADTEAMDALARRLEAQLGGHIHVMDFPNVDISSTMIRNRVSRGLSIRFLVPERVEAHIAYLGYYREQ